MEQLNLNFAVLRIVLYPIKLSLNSSAATLSCLSKSKCQFTPRVGVNASTIQRWRLRYCSHWKQWSYSKSEFQPYSGEIPLFWMEAVLLASLQHCRNFDVDPLRSKNRTEFSDLCSQPNFKKWREKWRSWFRFTSRISKNYRNKQKTESLG